VFAACLAAPAVGAPDEKSLWELWSLQSEAPDRHAEIAAACAAFEARAADDPLAAVSAGLRAWHLLKAGRTAAAEQVLAGMVSTRYDPLAKSGTRIARAWLTRIDREKVMGALRRHYARHVEFPATLAELAAEPQTVPRVDRWGNDWSYRLIGFRRLRGLPAQRYELLSTMLGRDSDLAAALARPYAGRIAIRPAGLMATADPPTVQFAQPGSEADRVYMSVGGEADGVTFAYLGTRLVVLADADHWWIGPRPGPAGTRRDGARGPGGAAREQAHGG
jgi:hypothetical protein